MHPLINVFAVIVGLGSLGSHAVYAGHSVGGGGTGVVCHDGNGVISSIEIYDYFYARKLGRSIGLGSPTADYMVQAQVALDRLAKFSPMRAKAYAERIKKFEAPSEAKFLKDTALFHVPDLGQPVLDPGPGCELVQIVYQQEPRFRQDRRYLINDFYWQKLSQTQKAGLVLHEVIYGEAMSYGQTDSSGAREFNITFSDATSRDMTFQDFYALLRAIPFVETDIAGNQFLIGQCFLSNDTHRQACQSPNDLESWLDAEFYDSGNLKKIEQRSRDGKLKVGPGVYKAQGDKIFAGWLLFYDLPMAILQGIDAKVGFNAYDIGETVLAGGPYRAVTLYPKGSIATAESLRQAQLPGKQWLAGTAWFSEQGALTQVQVRDTGAYPGFTGKYQGYPATVTGEAMLNFSADGSLAVLSGSPLINLTVQGSGGISEISGRQPQLEEGLSYRNDGSIEKAIGLTIVSKVKGMNCVPREMAAHPGLYHPLVIGDITFHPDGTLASGTIVTHDYRDMCLIKSDGGQSDFKYGQQRLRRHFSADGFWTGS